MSVLQCEFCIGSGSMFNWLGGIGRAALAGWHWQDSMAGWHGTVALAGWH